jgi:hypothetical protein
MSERYRSQSLAVNLEAHWYLASTVISKDFQTPTVKEEIRHYSSQYSGRLSVHPKDILMNIMAQADNRRLRRHVPNDLPTWLIV